MKLLGSLIIFLLLSCSNLLLSQPGWFRLNSGTNTVLNGISAAGDKIWAVGNNGTIIRSTNRGINWVQQVSGTSNDLNSVIFRNDSIGYIAGNSGTILRTTNSGINWITANTGTTQNLRSVCISFLDTITVIAAGDNGTIIKSGNFGITWVQKNSTVTSNLNSIVSWSYDEFFIAGDAGKILHSYNYGENWSQVSSGTTNNLRSLSSFGLWNYLFILLAVGDNGTILKTTNQGFNWTTVSSGTNENLRSVQGIYIMGDSLSYYIVTGNNGTMLESTNGGSWVNRNLPYTDNLNSIVMLDMNSGFAAGSNGTVLKSVGNYFYAEGKKLDANTISAFFRNDGGFNNDKEQNSSGFEWPKGSDKHARYTSGLWIGATVNGDTRVVTSGYYNEYYPGYTDNSSIPHGRNDTNYRIYKLNNGLSNTDRLKWPNSLLGNSDQGAPVYYDSISNTWKPVDFGSQTMFYAYTDSYPESHTNTLNGATLPLKADIKQLNFSLDVSGALGNVIFSQYTIINRSNDVWTNAYFTLWSDDDLGESLDDMVGCDSALSLGYTYNASNYDQVYGNAPPAVGIVLLRGAYSFTGNNNDTVSFCRNKTNISRTGYRDLKMKAFNFSINGGILYSDPHDYIESYNLMKGLMLDGSGHNHPGGFFTTLPYSGDPVTGTGWIAEDPGDYRLYVSTGPVNLNPGDTQVIVAAQVIARGTSNLNSITELRQYVDDLKEFYSSCYTSTPIGIINQSGIVRNFSLKQNYPNPFNPVTVIKYDVPVKSSVSIKIFDILGKEVFKINEFRNAGSYEVKFDGSNLASGIYFYSIAAVSSAGVFSDTKKMVLIVLI
jgi:photosystem II stability/assembly factor-like uncharacterized protein